MRGGVLSFSITAVLPGKCEGKRMFGFRLLTAIAVLSASVLTNAPAPAADRVAVRLDWTPWGSQAPLHLAAKKGLFAKHDLDVVLEDGNGSVATVQIVGNGEYDVGHASLAPMAIARSKGLPVKAIAGFIKQNDIGLLVPKDSGIKGPADLKGKKIAFTAGSLETPFIDRFLAAGKLKRSDVELISVDAAGKAGLYMTGQTDAAFSSGPFFLAVVAAQRPSNAIRFADHGLEFPSFGLMATEKSIATRREALKRFASVVSGSWAYIFAGHEDEAAQAIIAARPQAKLNPAVLRQQIDTLKDYALTDATRSLPFGTMAAVDWKRAVDVLAEGGLVDKSLDSNAVFTNELIDAAIVADIAAGKQ
jgi:NitT/TauT family transport system substrate-binding protein